MHVVDHHIVVYCQQHHKHLTVTQMASVSISCGRRVFNNTGYKELSLSRVQRLCTTIYRDVRFVYLHYACAVEISQQQTYCNFFPMVEFKREFVAPIIYPFGVGDFQTCAAVRECHHPSFTRGNRPNLQSYRLYSGLVLPLPSDDVCCNFLEWSMLLQPSLVVPLSPTSWNLPKLLAHV